MGNIYNELANDGSIVEMEAPSRRKTSEYLDVLSKLKGYKRIHDHLIEVEVNGKIETLAVFRIVAEGNKNAKDVKRVQIANSGVTEMPSLGILTIYVSEDAVVYGFSSDLEPLTDLPINNQTTLTRTKIIFLKKVFDGNNKSVEVISREHNVKYKYSKNFYDLFDKLKTFRDTESGFYFGSLEEEALDYQDDDLINESAINEKPEVGRFAEEKFFELLQNDLKLKKWIEDKIKEPISEFKWMNEDKESYESYDFLINGKIYIEIKGSESQGSFLWSNNEKVLASKVGPNEYLLFKFNGIDIAKQLYTELFKYTKQQLEEFEQTPVTILVKEK